jgi:hypothetical protein
MEISSGILLVYINPQLRKVVRKMKEKDNAELAKLRQNLANDQYLQDLQSVQIEGVRVQLERVARESVSKYSREVEATLPEAQRVIDQIIQPWFLDLLSAGTYAELLEWCKSHNESIRFSDTTIYYWPKRALRELEEKRTRPYLGTAQFVVERYSPREIQKGIGIHSDGGEAWYAGFDLKNSRWGDKNGVHIWRQPLVGMGFGYAMMASLYNVPVDVENISSARDDISPEVWINFGQQIESGKVWEAINQSMKPRRVVTATREETKRYREEDAKRAAEYLRTRSWY